MFIKVYVDDKYFVVFRKEDIISIEPADNCDGSKCYIVKFANSEKELDLSRAQAFILSMHLECTVIPTT